MLPTGFEIGMGVSWDDGDAYRYGVVMGEYFDGLSVTEVVPAYDGDYPYDDSRAVRSKHEHNVRLDDAPPPFTMLCIMSGNGACIAKADPNKRVEYTFDQIVVHGMSVIDDGAHVSDRDMGFILDHPWRDTPQQAAKPAAEKPKTGPAYASLMTAISGGEDDGPSGPEEPGFY